MDPAANCCVAVCSSSWAALIIAAATSSIGLIVASFNSAFRGANLDATAAIACVSVAMAKPSSVATSAIMALRVAVLLRSILSPSLFCI